MRRNKIIITVLILALVAVVFTACGKDKEKKDTSSEPTKLTAEVNIAVYGAGKDIAKNLPENYKVKKYTEQKKMEKDLAKGEFDLAILPTGSAAALYGKLGKGMKEMGPVTTNGVYVLSNNYDIASQKMSAFRGRTIYATGGHSTEVRVFEYLMREAGYGTDYYKLRILDSYGEVEKALKDYGNIALASEPAASSIMKSNGEIRKIMDLGERWKERTDQDVMTDVVIVDSDFTKARQDEMKLIYADLQEAVDKTKSKAKLKFYSTTNRGMSLLKAFNKELYDGSHAVFGDKKIKDKLYYQMNF